MDDLDDGLESSIAETIIRGYDEREAEGGAIHCRIEKGNRHGRTVRNRNGDSRGSRRRTAVVNGATLMDIPKPSITIAGKKVVQ